MFGDKNSKNSTSSSEGFVANTIQTGTSIKGEIVSDGSIRIDGKLDGSLSTKGKLVIGTSGVITGDVHCQNANIEGKVEGTVKVDEILILKRTAIIEGDIVTKKLVVEENAVFNGKITMGAKIQKAIMRNEEASIQKQAI